MLLGISLAGPPGPVTAILVERATRSVWKGIFVGFGAMSADFILMVVILVFGHVTNISRFDNYIYILGSIFFFYLAFAIYRSHDTEQSGNFNGSGYVAGLTIGLINPMQIGWWFTAGLSVFQKFGPTTMIFLFIGILIWVFFISGLIFKASAKYGNRVKYAIKMFSVLSLGFFGILFIYLSLTGITSVF
jgi:threonine/homoserine/homoserine lactone efflux protein